MYCHPITISKLRDLYKSGQLNLDPPYQRKPAWRLKQRELLLSSIFNGIPIPALIFHKHFDKRKKKEIYDVLDGKQRAETILHFIGYSLIDEQELYVRLIDPINNQKIFLSYDELHSRSIQKEFPGIAEKFCQYELPVIEYEDELYDFFNRNVASKEVFVRINSTGSTLKKHEIRHATSAGLFFQLGNELEKKYSKFFVEKSRIASKSDVDRYILHEFILELCTAIHHNNYTDKRKKLDELLSSHVWSVREIKRIKSIFIKVISWITDIFPKETLRFTRFKNKSDFYSLFVVLLNLLNKGYVITDRKSNRTAGKFLIDFSKQIQELDSKVKAYKNQKLSKEDEKLKDYVISTRQATDNLSNREIRHKYLLSVLKDGFMLKRKDQKRIFDKNVKDLLWTELIQKSVKPKCPNPTKNKNCKIYLTYDNVQVDHLHPWSKGGVTKLENARLICSSCNSSKGNR